MFFPIKLKDIQINFFNTLSFKINNAKVDKTEHRMKIHVKKLTCLIA
jgi:hypothetical protein